MLIPLLLNLGFAASGTVGLPAEEAVDRGRDAGHKPWWTGEWIDPNVVYAPEQLDGIVTKAKELRTQVRKLPLPEKKALTSRTARLVRRAEKLETPDPAKTAERIIDDYRQLHREKASLETEIARQWEAHRRRLVADDEMFMKLMLETLDA